MSDVEIVLLITMLTFVGLPIFQAGLDVPDRVRGRRLMLAGFILCSPALGLFGAMSWACYNSPVCR